MKPERAKAMDAHALCARHMHALIEEVRKTTDRVIATAAVPAHAYDEQEAEAIHDFRVALRRLRSLTRPLRPLYGRRKMRAMSQNLKLYASSTGDLRDEEVLHETLQALEVAATARAPLDAWVAKRVPLERRMRGQIAQMLAGKSRLKALAGLSGAGLSSHLDHLAAILDKGPKRKMPASTLARMALGPALAEVRAFARGVDPADGAAMHELRIRFKRLRYTAELLAPALGMPKDVAKHSAAMQKILGHLHDLDVASSRIGHSRNMGTAPRAAVLVALRRERAETARLGGEGLTRHLGAIEERFAAQRELG